MPTPTIQAKWLRRRGEQTWYQADQTQIDGLTLNVYLLELSQLVLERNWSHDILETILSSSRSLLSPWYSARIRAEWRGFRGIPRNPLIPGHQFFGVFGFTIPHAMMRNLDPVHADLWNLLGLFRAH